MSSRLGMWSRRVLYYHGLLLHVHPGYSILCLTCIHFSRLRLPVHPLESEQNGILEHPSAMHPKAFFSFSWILLLIVFNISYQATGILNFEDKGESSGPLLAMLARWSLGIALPYMCSRLPGQLFHLMSRHLPQESSYTSVLIMVFTVSLISLRPLIFLTALEHSLVMCPFYPTLHGLS